MKPMATRVLTYEEKERFVHIVANLKTPIKCVFSLKKRIKDGDLKGMKSHDYHVMMQEILLLCIWHLMTKDCRMAIIRLYCVFKKDCIKGVEPTTIGELKHDVATTLVLLEKEILPSFFDVMTRLLVHLVEELEFCGPVHT